MAVVTVTVREPHPLIVGGGKPRLEKLCRLEQGGRTLPHASRFHQSPHPIPWGMMALHYQRIMIRVEGILKSFPSC